MSEEEEIVIAEEINYNDDIIRIEEDEIILLKKRGNTYKPISIAGFNLKILYYTVDKIKRKYLYTFYANDELFYSYEVNNFLNLKIDKLFEWQEYRQVMFPFDCIYLNHYKIGNQFYNELQYINYTTITYNYSIITYPRISPSHISHTYSSVPCFF